MSNPFDFIDLSALPEAIRLRLAPKTSAAVDAVVELIGKAGRAVTIVEILAAAHIVGLKLPAESTVRTYLNVAVAAGRLVKPTRQTYKAA